MLPSAPQQTRSKPGYHRYRLALLSRCADSPSGGCAGCVGGTPTGTPPQATMRSNREAWTTEPQRISRATTLASDGLPFQMPYDLLLDASGDLPQQLRLATGEDLIVQRIRRRLQTHEGEVLTDRTQGLDFIGWIQDGISPDQIADRIRLELAGVPGIVAVLTCSGTFNRRTRTTTITAECQLDSGSILTIEGNPSSGGNSSAQWRVMMRGMGGMWPA